MKILLIDDSTINNIMLESMLAGEGYKTHSILESESAIDTIKSYQPQLILLDLMMPGISGFDILKKMKQESIQIPTIVVSAYKNQQYVRDVKKLGAVEYFSKPIDHKELVKAIEQYRPSE